MSLPPRLNKFNQFNGVIKLTPGQNPNNGPSFYVEKRKSRLQKLFLYKILSAVNFHSLTWNEILGAVWLMSKIYISQWCITSYNTIPNRFKKRRLFLKICCNFTTSENLKLIEKKYKN